MNVHINHLKGIIQLNVKVVEYLLTITISVFDKTQIIIIYCNICNILTILSIICYLILILVRFLNLIS